MKTDLAISPIRTFRVSQLAAFVSIALSITVLGVLTALHVLSPEFDPSFRMISEYAFGDYGWMRSLMFLVWGNSTWALAVAIWRGSTTSGRVGWWFLLAAGLGESWPPHSTCGICSVMVWPDCLASPGCRWRPSSLAQV